MKIFIHKKIFFGLLTLGFTSVFINTYAQQNVSISDVNGATPDVSSVLDVRSTSKGLLIPRVTLQSTTDGTTISSPAASLLVYNTNLTMSNGAGLGYYYNAGTSGAPNWQKLLSGNSIAEWKLLGNAGTVANTNFLGTTDAVDLVFRTNNTEKVRIMSGGNVGIGTASPSNKLSVLTSTSNDGVYATDGTRWTLHLPGTTGSGSYNNIVTANDNALIFSGGSIGTGNLVIAPWAAATTGIKILGSNGNVGVGISPNDRFEVFPTGGKSVLLGGGATTGSELKLTNSEVVHFSIYNSGNNNLTFANTSTNYQTNTAGAALMSITSGGNVGVGTTTPAQKLDVVGNVQFSQALMPNSNAGTTGQVLISQGANTAPIWGASGGPSGITVFTSSSGTYTVPSGVTKIWVRMVGGGGAGGGAVSSSYSICGAGGGAGGYCEGFILSPGTSYSYSVGAGGIGNNTGTGGAGGTTSFGTSLFVANGGGGGLMATSIGGAAYGAGGTGGAASGGSINFSGSSGGRSMASYNNDEHLAGAGGGSVFGSGGACMIWNAIYTITSINGESAISYGSGGGGAIDAEYSTAATGGNGASGIIIIYEYK